MATKSNPITVGTTRVNLLQFQNRDSKPNQRWTGYNNGQQTVWVGDAGVTVGNGIPIPPGYSGSEIIGLGDVLFGIASADTQLNVKMDGV